MSPARPARGRPGWLVNVLTLAGALVLEAYASFLAYGAWLMFAVPAGAPALPFPAFVGIKLAVTVLNYNEATMNAVTLFNMLGATGGRAWRTVFWALWRRNLRLLSVLGIIIGSSGLLYALLDGRLLP